MADKSDAQKPTDPQESAADETGETPEVSEGVASDDAEDSKKNNKNEDPGDESSNTTSDEADDDGEWDEDDEYEWVDEDEDEGDEDEGDEDEGDEDEDEDEDDDDEDDELDLDRRFLCSDGACIGVIGAKGKCKVCGKPLAHEDRAAFERAFGKASAKKSPKPADGESVSSDLDAEDESSEDESSEGEPRASAEKSQASEAKVPFTYDPNARVLCSDGACIGLIGPSGKCKECGKPYEGEPDLD